MQCMSNLMWKLHFFLYLSVFLSNLKYKFTFGLALVQVPENLKKLNHCIPNRPKIISRVKKSLLIGLKK